MLLDNVDATCTGKHTEVQSTNPKTFQILIHYWRSIELKQSQSENSHTFKDFYGELFSMCTIAYTFMHGLSSDIQEFGCGLSDEANLFGYLNDTAIIMPP
jgi:hypothetical protein